MHGDLSYRRRVDPVRGAFGDDQHSLEAGWQTDGRRLSVYSDRLGLIPIFVLIERGRTVVSDSLIDIAAVTTALQWDFDALSVYLRVGFFLGEDTPFKNIKVMPPATVLATEISNLR